MDPSLSSTQAFSKTPAVAPMLISINDNAQMTSNFKPRPIAIPFTIRATTQEHTPLVNKISRNTALSLAACAQ
jgi:hypothetical protein